jgi:hypothetical protein
MTLRRKPKHVAVMTFRLSSKRMFYEINVVLDSKLYTFSKYLKHNEDALTEKKLQIFDYWDRGFESRRGHRCSSLVFVVCCAGSGICDELNYFFRGVLRSVCVCVCNRVCSRYLNNESA